MQVINKRTMDALSQPYSSDRLSERFDPTRPSQGTPFALAVGVAIPEVEKLFHAIDSDMDLSLHGVGWWVGHPVGDRRRIFISDHLLQAVRSIEINLVDARLPELCLEHCEELEDRLTQHMVTARRSTDRRQFGLDMKSPRRETAREDLPRCLGDLHRGGFFRAMAQRSTVWVLPSSALWGSPPTCCGRT